MSTESAPNGSSRRDELLAVAAKLFAARGYHGTRMDDVADAVGLNKATVYHYYASKSLILWDIYKRTADFIHDEEIRKLVPPDFGRKAMENLLRANGLRASEIDAILRHALQGQTTNCVTSDTAPLVRWRGANLAVTKIAVSIFKEVGFGLAKE